MASRLLCPTAARSLGGPVETTLRQLLVEYGLDAGDSLLLSLGSLQETLIYYGIQCSPPVGSLDLDDLRVLSGAAVGSLEIALSQISGGETAEIEFKSSLIFDWRKHLENPNLELSQYRLEALIHSALKTMAAYANTDGGVLYIGVTDNGDVCGLVQDFILANVKRGDYDGWEQFLRAQVESKFTDGKSVNSYIKTESLLHDGKNFVRLQVAARSELTFLKRSGGASELYIRSGTRSVAVQYEDIQKHYEMRRKF